MIKTTVYDIKTHFSEYLAKVIAGENVVIYEKNIPVAELHRTSIGSRTSRPIGLAKNSLTYPHPFSTIYLTTF